MKRLLWFIPILMLLAACTPAPTPAPEPPTVEEEPALPGVEDATDSLVWRVEPTLEYEEIFYCGALDRFTTGDHSGYKLDLITGQITTEPWTDGHGGEADYFFYDEEKDLYAYYTDSHSGGYLFLGSENDFNVFLETTNWSSNSLLAYQKIDSDRIISFGPDHYDPLSPYDLSDANIGEKYALAYGTKFVSDFIYSNDRYNLDYSFSRVKSMEAMELNNKWGVLDKDGNVAIPFVFEDILLIDEETAFAKFDGKYGILELPQLPEISVPYVTTSNLNLRAGPSTEAAIITTVPHGTTVIVTDFRDNEWFQVEYDGQVGYMKADFLFGSELADNTTV